MPTQNKNILRTSWCNWAILQYDNPKTSARKQNCSWRTSI